MGKFTEQKELVLRYFDEMEHCKVEDIASVLKKYTADDYTWEGVFPFMDLEGTDAVAETFWVPLRESLTTMQRRQDVFMAGEASDGKTWVTCMGQFMGLFDKEFLGVRITGKMHHLQFVEFSQIENGKIQHTAMFVDLLGFMKEAGCYPLPPETGHYFVYPGPKDHNGLMYEDAPAEQGQASMDAVKRMIDYLDNNVNDEPFTPAETLAKYWTEDLTWYGPCGIGSVYTIPRYQQQDQVPFRAGLFDTKIDDIHAWFAEGDFVCLYAEMTSKSRGGWLGMAGGTNADIRMRGDLDIYCIKDGRISENWCLIDLPYWLYQQGLNIFNRTQRIINPQIK